MGLPGAIYMSGLSESWIAIGLVIGAYLNWLFVAGRLRVQTEHNGDALTLPDYFSSRFEDKSGLLRIISAVVILVFFTIYCASGIVAGARLFESTFGMSYETALWAGALATIAYTFIGGFLAVSWTDTVQATLMIFALLLTPIIVLLATGGKSIHAYWRLSEPITPERWRPLIQRLIAYCKSDPTCKNPSRLMRLAGSSYIHKSDDLGPDGQSIGGTLGAHPARMIRHSPAAIYLADVFEERLPELPKPEPPAPAPAPSTGRWSNY